MGTEERQLDLEEHMGRYYEMRGQLLPEVRAEMFRLEDVVYKDGALSSKSKRLQALAVALALGCEACIIYQTRKAVESGATKEEVLETSGVLLAIHGTTGWGEGWRVVKVLEELGMM